MKHCEQHPSRNSSAKHFAVIAGTVALLFLAAASVARAQTYTVIHTFTGPDGANPAVGLTIDRAGNLYGTTAGGGDTNCESRGCGTVFKLAHKGSAWVLSELLQFDGSFGGSPQGRVSFGPDGLLYGTVPNAVFSLRPAANFCSSISCPWTPSVLFTAGYGTGEIFLGDLAFDAAGNIYGTAEIGPGEGFCNSGCGAVYQLVKSGNTWSENLIHEFQGVDGFYPTSGVILDQAGDVYGTTLEGGSGDGTVFEVSPSGSGWTFNKLHEFMDGADGASPSGGLIFDGAGNLYGATSAGGPGNGGAVYELLPSNGSWNFNALYDLTGGNSGPAATLLMDRAGNLYGTSVKDGANGFGSVFKLTPSDGGWTYTSLHDFTDGSDGAYPYDGLVMDANGNLYGTTQGGGITNEDICSDTDLHRCGVVFEITP